MAWGENEEGIKADSQVPWLKQLGKGWYGDSPGQQDRWLREFLQGLQSSPPGACKWVCPPEWPPECPSFVFPALLLNCSMTL